MRPLIDILPEVNSATKYPSISTYHPINQGILEESQTPLFKGGTVIGTEKVDGTNARMIFLPDGTYLIGSREELLYAGGDIIHNPSQGIVNALRRTADYISDTYPTYQIFVVYGEVYGGKIGGQWKNYTTDPALVGFRMFDAAYINPEVTELAPKTIAAHRDAGALHEWFEESALQYIAPKIKVELTPRLFEIDARILPTSIELMNSFLNTSLPSSHAPLSASAQGKAEGIVLRTPDRSVIAKARFQDYRKTLQKMSSVAAK